MPSVIGATTFVENRSQSQAEPMIATAETERAGSHDLRLGDIPLGEVVELVRLDLPEAELESLLERGVMPGCRVCPIRKSPFGDPIVDVDGTVLALRREMAGCLCVRRFAESRGA